MCGAQPAKDVEAELTEATPHASDGAYSVFMT